ncbi:aminopeptidase C [Lactobacillus pasteurii DSM 23907 = CRBIP 24.76]|uniref:Aminopeptidase n=1 Tax=Lactobacillus pasteurii DSM 23907 = CRBIP 24.76 TaxID=1423790 RepID=I7LDH2_9LACO|nr:C1 family peptidase [Lactobacillus pasteurii]KRK08234.1 aminopeptidase C [Lactobacillus pasteurii DSM 23907 = CRBIP 24.76]TDG77353.1 hypothetical protein C5L33_000796 [Lactobacillus pasteurii]CCI84898.1 Aminopeptidase C [Lactobacillus pasteurii DSM 23907 = CRBIP 24.76]
MVHEFTIQEAEEFRKNFEQEPANEAISRAARRSGILEASFNSKVSEKLNRVFSIELPVDQVTNQKHSGRCWEFSSLNVLRHHFGKKYHVKNFEFSQVYNFFWDKIERANIYYDHIIETADKPLDDREVAAYLAGTGYDGGEWAMAVALIKKYGVVPSYAMPESFNSDNTSAIDDFLARKKRKDGLVLRKLVQAGKMDEVEENRKKFLNEIYHIVATAFGQPPKVFDLEYRDDDKNYHLDKNLTPQQFLHKYLADFDFDDYVGISNSPNYEYEKVYHDGYWDNVVGKDQVKFLNLPMSELTKMAIEQLKDGEAVLFGNDVLKQMERKSGYLSTDLYKTDELFGVSTKMSKADRLATGEGGASHAMTLVGVDLDQGEVRQWKVENSWGSDNGEKGYFVMSHQWFEDYVYHVIVHKKYLTDSQRKLLDGPVVDLKPWQMVG